MRKDAQDDFDTIADRVIPFAVRGKTREKLELLAEEHRQRLLNLRNLTGGGRLGCPLCRSSERVRIVGNGRNGTKKFECKAQHDPDSTGRKDRRFRFSTYTSYEALKVYRDFLEEVLTLLTYCEGTREGVAEYLSVSKHVVEFGVHVLLDYLGKEGARESVKVGDDLVVVYADFSTTRVSRSASVIMSRVGESIAYQVCCSMNYLTAWNFVRALKERLALKPGATLVFVTDGEKAWIDPIRTFFPNTIHIRQFHSEASLGLVYVHLPFRRKVYTLRCRWDAVLGEGKAGERVLEMRGRRKLNSSEKPGNRTGLFDGVILWEGMVREPRGVRRKRGASVSGAMGGDGNQTLETHLEKCPQRAPGTGIGGIGESKRIWQRDDGWIAPRTDSAKELFKGSWDEALRFPIVRRARSILVRVFGGLHITSNAAECLFDVKPALRYHRTVKSGTALVHVLLYLKTRLRRLGRAEVKAFLRNEVVTFERIRRVAVRAKMGQGNRKRKEEIEQIVLEACRETKPLVIHYRDFRGRRTSRMIEPLKIQTDPYTGILRLRAYCYLRDAERTFLLDRIANAIPVDTDLSIIA